MTKKPFIALATALVLLVLVIVAYVFWYQHVVSLRSEVAALRAEAESVTASALQISAARSALSKLAEDEAFFGSYFVSTSTVVSYLEHIESTGDSLGSLVEVVSVNPEGKTRLAISFRATGPFAGVMRTLGAIEYGAYDVTIKNLNLDTNASSEGTWTATGVISLGMGPTEAEKPKEEAKPAEDDPLI